MEANSGGEKCQWIAGQIGRNSGASGTGLKEAEWELGQQPVLKASAKSR